MRRRRRGGAVAAWSGAVIVLAIALAVVFRTEVAGFAIRTVLEEKGAAPARLEVSELSFDRLVLRGVGLGREPTLSAGEVTAEYSIFGLIAGRLDELRLKDVVLRLDPFGGGPALGALQPLAGGEGKSSGTSGPPPLPPVRFDDLRIEVATPLGPVTARLDGTARASPAVVVASDVAITGAAGSLTGRLAVGGPSLADWTAQLSILEGALDTPGLVAQKLTGELSATVAKGRPRRLRARLSAGDLASGDLRPGRARLALDASEQRIAFAADLGEAAAGLALQARADVSDVETAPAFKASAELFARSRHPLLAERLAALGLSGDGRLKLEASGTAPPPGTLPASLSEALTWLASGAYQGRVGLALGDVAYRDRIAGLALTLPLAVRFDHGALDLSLEADAHAKAEGFAPLGPDAAGPVAEVLRPFAHGSELAVAAKGEHPFDLRLARAGDGWTVALRAAASLSGKAKAALGGSAELTATLDRSLSPERWTVASAALEANGVSAAGVRGLKGSVAGAFEGGADSLRGTARLDARAARLDVSGLACRGVEVDLPLRIDAGSATVAGETTGQGAIRAARCGYRNQVRTRRRLALDVHEAKARLDPAARSLSLALAPGEVSLLLTGSSPERLDLHIPALRADGTLRADGGVAGKAEVDGMRLDLPDRKLRADVAAARAAFGEPSAGPLLRVDGLRLTHLGKPAAFAPVSLAGTVRDRGGRLVASATLKGGGGLIDGRIEAFHRTADGSGEARLDLAPLVFAPGRGAPKDLSPLLGRIKDATGEVRLDGLVRWGKGGVHGTARGRLADLSFKSDGIAVSGLAGTVALADIAPPTTAAPQHLEAQSIEAGVPFDDVRLSVSLPRGMPGKVRIDSAEAHFAGSRFTLGETVVDPAAPRNEFRLRIAGLDLARISKLANVEGVSATGVLAGTIPIAVSPGGFSIDGGRLVAAGPGRLAIRSEQAKAALGAGGAPVALVLQALEDFRYKALSLDIDKPVQGASGILMHIEGANPAVLKGHPFAFNINLKGDFEKIVSILRQGADLSSEVLRRRGLGR